MMENTVYTSKQMFEFAVDTSAYVFNYVEGSFSARLDLKAEGHGGMLRLFFTFDDGRKIIAPVYWWQNYLDFYGMPLGSRVRLTYTKTSHGTFLSKAELIEENE